MPRKDFFHMLCLDTLTSFFSPLLPLTFSRSTFCFFFFFLRWTCQSVAKFEVVYILVRPISKPRSLRGRKGFDWGCVSHLEPPSFFNFRFDSCVPVTKEDFTYRSQWSTLKIGRTRTTSNNRRSEVEGTLRVSKVGYTSLDMRKGKDEEDLKGKREKTFSQKKSEEKFRGNSTVGATCRHPVVK